MAVFCLLSVLLQGTAGFPGLAPTSAGHTGVCHSHRKQIQPWGSSALSPRSGLNLWFSGVGRDVPTARQCPGMWQGEGSLPLLDFSPKEDLGMSLAPQLSPLSPANPRLQQAVHRPGVRYASTWERLGGRDEGELFWK